MVQLPGNSNGSRRQASPAKERVEGSRQARCDFHYLDLADAAETCRAPRSIAHFRDKKIRRDQSGTVLDNCQRLVGERLFREKPFERDARVNDQAHRASRSSRTICSAVGYVTPR